jgi:quinol monooxygenase YgiN
MSVTVQLELRFKPESVAEAREVFARELKKTRASHGCLVTDVLVDEDDEAHWVIHEVWETVADDEAYRAFRAGDGKITDLPPLLAAPPVKIRYSTTDI